MSRLIDADALKTDYIVGSTSTNTECYRYVSLEQIMNTPTADVAEVPRWIPVTERLPIPNERIGNVRKYYLIQNEYGDMMVACYNGEWEQIYRHEYYLDKVVAWMPLPKLWEGEEDEPVN